MSHAIGFDNAAGIGPVYASQAIQGPPIWARTFCVELRDRSARRWHVLVLMRQNLGQWMTVVACALLLSGCDKGSTADAGGETAGTEETAETGGHDRR
jgi:hypothetical protein